MVRLRRYRGGGASDLADENPLPAGTRKGRGETVFRVPQDGGHYRAELGLSDGAGGWLMLARSNAVDITDGVGLTLERRPEDGAERAPATGAGAAPLELPPDLQIEPALAPAREPLTAREFPLGDDPRAPREPAAGPAALPAAFQSPLSADPPEPAADPSSDASPLPIPGRKARAHEVPGAPRLDDGSEERDRKSPNDEPDGIGAPPHLAEALAAPLPGIGVRIEPLSYTRPAPRADALELDAELRISGRAAPGSEVDLLGYPYRVGPGGRFQLTLRITDEDLLRRALAQSPPPELGRRREED